MEKEKADLSLAIKQKPVAGFFLFLLVCLGASHLTTEILCLMGFIDKPPFGSIIGELFVCAGIAFSGTLAHKLKKDQIRE